MTLQPTRHTRRKGARRAHGGDSAWWRRPYAWVGTVATALVIAVVTSLGTGIGQHLLSEITGAASHHGLPVKIDDVSVGRDAVQGGTYVFPQKLILTPPQLRELNQVVPGGPQYDAWFRSRGAVDPSWSSIKLVIEGNRSHAVELIGMRPVKRCQKPLSGTLFYSPPAGAALTIGIGFNLDSITSTAQNYHAYRLSGDYFATHTVSLGSGEIQTLQIMAKAFRQSCRFTLELTVLDGTRQTTETVSNHGQPFRVTGINEPFSYYKALYAGGVAPGSHRGGFVPQDPATYKG